MVRIELYRGDITKLYVDAVVNAANNSLLGGGGVDGAIHRAAGDKLLKECKTLNGCETGNAKLTGAYNLPSEYVIHTVGPVWRGGGNGERKQLKSAYNRSLELASKNGIRSIAFPNISTGVYGFPKHEAARIAILTVKQYLSEHSEIEKVIYAIFDRENYDIYEELLS